MNTLSLGVLTDTTAGDGFATNDTPFVQDRGCVAHVNVDAAGILVVDIETSPDDVTYTSVKEVTVAVAGQSTVVDVPKLSRYVRANCSAVTAGQVEVVLVGYHG